MQTKQGAYEVLGMSNNVICEIHRLILRITSHEIHVCEI